MGASMSLLNTPVDPPSSRRQSQQSPYVMRAPIQATVVSHSSVDLSQGEIQGFVGGQSRPASVSSRGSATRGSVNRGSGVTPIPATLLTPARTGVSFSSQMAGEGPSSATPGAGFASMDASLNSASAVSMPEMTRVAHMENVLMVRGRSQENRLPTYSSTVSAPNLRMLSTQNMTDYESFIARSRPQICSADVLTNPVTVATDSVKVSRSDGDHIGIRFLYSASTTARFKVYIGASVFLSKTGNDFGPPQIASAVGCAEFFDLPKGLDQEAKGFVTITASSPSEYEKLALGRSHLAAAPPETSSPEHESLVSTWSVPVCIVSECGDIVQTTLLDTLLPADLTARGIALDSCKQFIAYRNRCYEVSFLFGSHSVKPQASNALPSSLADNDEEGNNACVICLSEERTTIVLPCRHLCLCNTCANITRQHSRRCPICRNLVSSFLQMKNGTYST